MKMTNLRIVLYGIGGCLGGFATLAGVIGLVWLGMTYPDAMFIGGMTITCGGIGTILGLMTYESQRRKERLLTLSSTKMTAPDVCQPEVTGANNDKKAKRGERDET